MKVIAPFLLLVMLALSVHVHAEQDATSSLDPFIKEMMRQAAKPGAAVAIVKDGGVVLAKGYGYADLGRKTEMTAETPVVVASISKVIVALAVMQLKEEGKVGLDEDVNRYLPFQVRNVYYPQKPITLRMLLTHTSGIADNWPGVLWWLQKQGDPTLDLGSFVKGYLAEGGRYYQRGNFAKLEPGTKFRYSGIDICLAAHIVEQVSGQEFEEYCRNNIFTPLGMRRTSWYFRNLDVPAAIPYERPFGLFYVKQGYYSAPYYPAGFLKTTAHDLARLMAMLQNNGCLAGVRVLGDESVNEMLAPQEGIRPSDCEQQALGFQHELIDGRSYVGHVGGLWGVASVMFTDREKRVGAIIVTNGGWRSITQHWSKEAPMRAIFSRLISMAEVIT